MIFIFGNFAEFAFASDQRKLTYAGRILKSDGTPVNASTQFKLQVTDTLGTCVMWEENITSTVVNGVFDLQLGSGTPAFDGGGSGLIEKVFAQGVAVSCKSSTPSASLIPATTDDRNLAVSFNDGSGWQTMSSQIPIKTVPFAMSANGIAGAPVNLSGLADSYVLKYDLATNTWIPAANGAGAGVSNVSAGTGITVGGTAAVPIINLSTPVSAANGGTGLNTSAAANGQLLIGTGAGLALNTLTAGSGISITNVSGAITIAATGAGTVTSVTSAGAPIVVGGTAAAPTVGINQATTTTAGYLSSTDWNTFNNKLSVVSNSANLASGRVWIGDGAGKAQEITLSQDVTTTNAGVTTVNRIQNVLVNSTGVAGGMFMYDTATSTWRGKAFPACTTAQAPYWNSGTDTIQCQTVAPAFSSVTGTPTTLSGYGITDAIRNAGSGAGNIITSVQSGNTAGRPAFGTDGRIYIDTQAGAIYRDSGTAWVQVSGAGGGGTVTGVTASAPLASSGGTAPDISLTGIIPLANGGTNANLTASNGGVVWSNASQMQILAGTATAGLPLISGSTATPSWSTINLSSGNIQMPAGGNISNASGAMTVSATTNLTVQSNSGSTTTVGNSVGASSTTINGGGVGGSITLTPGSLGLGVTGWTSGFVKSNGSGVLAPASLASGDVTTALGYTPVNKVGDTMTGPLVNNSNSASTALAVTQSGAGYAATFMGGNVGIGTASPAQKLSVAGMIESTLGGFKFPDGTVQTTASSAGSGNPLGTWNARTIGTIYQAASDGFVVASAGANLGASCYLSGWTDATATPTTNRANTSVFDVNGSSDRATTDTMVMPVRNGDYYKVTYVADAGSCSTSMYWMPLSGSTALWTLNGAHLSYSAGNVGVGTTTPVNALDIANGGGIRIAAGTPGSTAAALYNVGGALYWNGSAVGSGSGTVSTVSVATANGFGGTVSNASTTPAITLTTGVTGLLKGNGTGVSAAVAGTDYLTGTVGLANGNILQNTQGSSMTANNMLMTNATGVQQLASVASGVLTSSASVPSWSTSVPATMGGTGQTTYAIGDLLYASTTSALSRLPASTSGYLLTSNGAGTAPSWQSAAATVTAAVAPSFMVNKGGTAQTVTTNTNTKLTFGTVTFDTIGAWSTGTNRYTPTVAGKYLFTANVYAPDAVAVSAASIYKNGLAASQINSVPNGGNPSVSVTTVIVDMNGTTDYVEAYGYNGGGTSISGTSYHTFFTGALLAPLASGSVAGTGTANYVPMWTSSTTQSSSPMAVSGSNVGIGITSPQNKLVVKTGTDINLGITTGVSDVTAVKLNAMNDAASLNIPLEMTATKFNFVGGNVGVGTTNPTSKLEVAGDIKATGGGTIGVSKINGTFGSASTNIPNGVWTYIGDNITLTAGNWIIYYDNFYDNDGTNQFSNATYTHPSLSTNTSNAGNVDQGNLNVCSVNFCPLKQVYMVSIGSTTTFYVIHYLNYYSGAYARVRNWGHFYALKTN